jgi:hypothetical protein
MFVLNEKMYDIQMVSYMKTLQSNPVIINQNVIYNTIKSVTNQMATFLDHDCPKCSLKLIDPIGKKLKNSLRHASCGNCGFYSFVKFDVCKVLI